jgi:hypothetical protein
VAKKDEDKAPQLVELFKAVSDAIQRSPLSRKEPPPFLYKTFRPIKNSEVKILLKIDPKDNSSVVWGLDGFANDVMEYLQTNQYIVHPWYQWDYEKTMKFAKFYNAICPVIDEPPPFRWLGEDGLAYVRLPWEKKTAPHPTWDRFFQRIKNAPALRLFIGSLFVMDSDIQQYVWLYGEGNDGKGALNRILAKVFAAAYHSGQPPAPNDRFWGYLSLIGRRLVVFPDCNAAGFVASGYFKALTGGDPLAVEKKMGAMFVYKHNAKFMFYSNVKPKISSQKADTRRLILCEFLSGPDVDRIDGSSQAFEKALWDEAGGFFYDCIVEYLSACPDRGGIPLGDDAVDDLAALASRSEEDFEVAFENTFEVVVGDEAVFCLPAVFQSTLKSLFSDAPKRREEFVSWMERTHGVKKSAKRIDKETRKVYKCLRLKSQQKPG